MKPTKYIIIVLIALVCATHYHNYRLEKQMEEICWHTDTTYRAYADTVSETRIDTIWHVYYCPIPIYRNVVDTLLYISTDTVTMQADTIALPKEQVCYTDDSTYVAYISGYRPELDSIITYRYEYIEYQRIIIQQEATIRKLQNQLKPRKWDFGITAGYGITPHGPDPFLGVGVRFNLSEK